MNEHCKEVIREENQVKDESQRSRVDSASRYTGYFNRGKICEKLSLELALEMFNGFSKNH